MNTTKFLDESHLKRICINVKEQLLTSNVIIAKATQLRIPHNRVAEQLDNFIYEWVANLTRDSGEFKNLTGWILFDSVKKRFLNL